MKFEISFIKAIETSAQDEYFKLQTFKGTLRAKKTGEKK